MELIITKGYALNNFPGNLRKSDMLWKGTVLKFSIGTSAVERVSKLNKAFVPSSKNVIDRHEVTALVNLFYFSCKPRLCVYCNLKTQAS